MTPNHRAEPAPHPSCKTNVNDVDLVLLCEGLMEPIDCRHREETLWGITGLLMSSVG